MKIVKFTTFFACALLMSNCCNMDQAAERLGKILDSGDAEAAVEAIEDPCISKMPRIQSTKAMLLLRLSMDQPDERKKKILRERGIDLLKVEANRGDSSAISILEDYERLGGAYLETFPWGSLLGPAQNMNSPRGW